MSHVIIRKQPPEGLAFVTMKQFRAWIEKTLGASLEQTVMAEIGLSLDKILSPRLFPELKLWIDEARKSACESVVERVSVPEGAHPVLELDPEPVRHRDSEVDFRWRLRWFSVPLAVYLRRIGRPVFVLPVRVEGGSMESRERWITYLICHRDDLVATTEELGLLCRRHQTSKTIFIANAPDQEFRPCRDWDHLVLDSEITSRIRDDFFRFLESRQWFESKGIPFRRGYLLYGPPGNGKTSVVRAMASTPGVSPCSLAWGHSQTDDDDLTLLFRWAGDHAPALVIIEDIDRHFSRGANAEVRHRISLAHLLNCLDGIQSGEGVVVVATANDPSALDPAILNRPGRFDRVVEFPKPSPALRGEYFRKQLAGACTEAGLQRMTQLSKGFSFAQLRESFVTAAYMAFEAGRDVTEGDVLAALEQLAGWTRGRRDTRRPRKAIGFPDEEAVA